MAKVRSALLVPHSEHVAAFGRLLALLLVAACARVPTWTPEDGRAEGERLYLHACASCHGANARGGGPTAGALRSTPPDLTTLAARHDGRFPRQYVLDVLAGRQPLTAHGTREMPIWADHFGSGTGQVASLHAVRRAELLADHLEVLQGAR